MSYAFRKLYADLITNDGTVCVVYLTWFEAMGMTRTSAGIELYGPDGSREVLHATGIPSDLDRLHPPARLELQFDLAGGRVAFSQQVVHGTWEPALPQASEGLSWSVLVGRATAELRWLDDPKRPTLRGNSYADHVVLTRLTRRLGLARLEWGRIHLDPVTRVFNRVTLRSGAEWVRGVRWAAQRSAEATDYRVDWKDGDACVTAGDEAVRLSPTRVLHEGSPFDAARVPKWSERVVAAAITGPSWERRWLSRAREDRDPAVTGWALHEEVRFGR